MQKLTLPLGSVLFETSRGAECQYSLSHALVALTLERCYKIKNIKLLFHMFKHKLEQQISRSNHGIVVLC